MSESTIPVSKITPIGGSVISPKHEHTSSKQTSQKKIEANRRNALHSTGPKTERGKRTVSRNAVKHGLLAREVVIAQGNGAENAEEFAELLTALRDDYLPVGISEELLVEEIATCYWRRARVLRFEMGETRKHLDDAAMSYELQRLDEAHLNVSLLRVLKLESNKRDAADEKLSRQEWFEVRRKLQSSLRTHPIGINYVTDILTATKVEIQEKGSLSSEELVEGLMSTIGFCDESLLDACISLMPEKNNETRSELSSPNTDENTENDELEKKEFAIRLLDHRLEFLKSLLDSATKNYDLLFDAQIRSLALPDERATDKVLRYQTHLDRQLYRAMDQLERLQRRRKGENVPPPLNVNFGGNRVFAKQSQ